jgi:hypothetical protein
VSNGDTVDFAARLDDARRRGVCVACGVNLTFEMSPRGGAFCSRRCSLRFRDARRLPLLGCASHNRLAVRSRLRHGRRRGNRAVRAGGGCKRRSMLVRKTSGVRKPLPSPSATIATVPRGVPGSVHIVARGEGPRRRFLVRFRLGGREAALEHAGLFKRKADAVLRRNFVIGLMAAGEGDEIRRRLRSTGAADGAVTVRTAAERWQASRVDVAAGTAQTYRVALSRILPRLAIGRWRRSTSRRSPTWCPSCRG